MHSLLQKTTRVRARLIHQLRRIDGPEAAALAATLASCRDTNSCRSAACPVCGLAFQHAACSLVEAVIREPARKLRGRMSAITIIPSTGCEAPEELTGDTFRRSTAEISAALTASGVGPCVVGIEASFNEDETGRVPPHWCVHGHIIALDWLSRSQGDALRSAFPGSDQVRRPVKIEPLDQDIAGRLYPFKPEKVRRVTYQNDHNSKDNRGPSRDTHRRDLRPWQAVRLALIEHRLSYRGRLITHGIDKELAGRHLWGFGWPRDGP